VHSENEKLTKVLSTSPKVSQINGGFMLWNHLPDYYWKNPSSMNAFQEILWLSTSFGTSSGTPSGTWSSTQIAGDFTVSTLTDFDGRIEDVGFACNHTLQPQNSTYLRLSGYNNH
jgi:hypothetical protein